MASKVLEQAQESLQDQIEDIQNEAKKEGVESVKKAVEECSHQYQELLINHDEGINPEELSTKTMKTLIQAMVYPELDKEMKRLEELFSSYRARVNPE